MAVVDAYGAAVQLHVRPHRHIGGFLKDFLSAVLDAPAAQGKVARPAALAGKEVVFRLIAGEMPPQPAVRILSGRQVEFLQADDVRILSQQEGADGIGQGQAVLGTVGVGEEAHIVAHHLQGRLPFQGLPVGLVISAYKEEGGKKHRQ